MVDGLAEDDEDWWKAGVAEWEDGGCEALEEGAEEEPGADGEIVADVAVEHGIVFSSSVLG